MREAGRRRWLILSAALLLGLAGIAVVTVRDYGTTWDEDSYREYGIILFNWYSSLGADQAAVSKWGLFQYGGFFDLLCELAIRVSPFGIYETRHLISTAFGLLGLMATCGIGFQIAGLRGGFFATLFLALTPVYYGAMFNNAKDIPFAALFAVSLFCILRALKHLPNIPKALIAQVGIAIGLAMAVRVAGVVLLGYLAVVWGVWLLSRHWANLRLQPRGFLRAVGASTLQFFAVTVIAWLTMVAFWPYAQVSPILNPLQIARNMANYDWPMTVFFEGHFVKASELPRHYLPTWFSISMPEFYFVLAIIGMALGAAYLWRLVRGRAGIDPLLKIGLLVVVACLPVVMQITMHSTVYDGLRQFLFVMPALAALAGVSAAALLSVRIHVAARVALLTLISVSATVTIYDMAELHPYQYIYFNRLVAGGVESAGNRFETDYFGTSYREGVKWLVENYHSDPKVRVRVGNPSNDFLTEYYLQSTPERRARFQHVKAWDKPHVYISTTRWNRHKSKQGRVLHVVRRKGVPLLYLIEINPPIVQTAQNDDL